MKYLLNVALLTLAVVAPPRGAEHVAPTQAGRPLSEGDEAPAFSLVGSDGRTYRLSDYRGKQVVVLAWFARAFSGG